MAAFTDELHCLLLPYLAPRELLQLLLACSCSLTRHYRWELLRMAAARAAELQKQRRADGRLLRFLRTSMRDALMEHRTLELLGRACTRWWLGPWSMLGETEESIVPTSAHLEEARLVLSGEFLDVLGDARVHVV